MLDNSGGKCYLVGDPTSSPYEPMITDIVIYKNHRQGLGVPETLPAIVVKAYDDDSADLVVFSSIGNRHVMRVRFNSDITIGNSYYWPPAKVARPIVGVDMGVEALPKETPVTPDEAVDKGQQTVQA
tara:strand:+ start:41706 stop:42086 length:381 start_codon:yes stop_codon:yes gene_type:complete